MLAVALAVALLALAGERTADMASRQAQREREQRLLRIGAAYARALRDWHDASPGNAPRWPETLSDLLEDRRYVHLRRHLRTLYPDPITGAPWGLVQAPGGGIMGVYSTSDEAPLAQAAGPAGSGARSPAQRYSDWRFIAGDDASP